MGLQKVLAKRKLRRKYSIRKKIQGINGKLRLSVFRSSVNIYAQLINDDEQKTVLAVSTVDSEVKKRITPEMTKIEQAKLVGKILAEKSLEAGIKDIAFDRNGFLFTGRVKALADSVRESGLEF